MSRFRHVDRSRKLKKPRRDILIPGHKDYGDGEDDGKWFRCSVCGFIYDKDERGIGVRDKDEHLEPGTYTQTDQYGVESFHCEGVAGATQTICEAAGGTWTSRGYKPADRMSGCPLCGT